MGEGFCYECVAHHQFFFKLLVDIKSQYPIIYEGGGSSKPHSKAYRDFAEKWGAVKTLYDIADEKIEKIEKIYQIYLTDYLQYLSFMIEKNIVEEEEDKFQDNLRKAKRGR